MASITVRMSISAESLAYIGEKIEYDPIKGTLIWRSDTSRQYKGDSAVYFATAPGVRATATVRIGHNETYCAGAVCWYLHTGHWPENGVVFVDKTPEGRRNLKRSNLRPRRATGERSQRIQEIINLLRRIETLLLEGDE